MRANAPDPDIAAIAAMSASPPARACSAHCSTTRRCRSASLPIKATSRPRQPACTSARLTDAGLVVGHCSGRTHRYQLAGVQAAQALEALRLAQPPPTRSLATAAAANRSASHAAATIISPESSGLRSPTCSSDAATYEQDQTHCRSHQAASSGSHRNRSTSTLCAPRAAALRCAVLTGASVNLTSQAPSAPLFSPGPLTPAG